MLGKHWAIVWSRVSSAHPFIISLKHEKAKPTRRPNSNRFHPQVLAHMWVRTGTHGAWAHSRSKAVERWVGIGELGAKGRERGEGAERRRDSHLRPRPPPAPGARCPGKGRLGASGTPGRAGCARALQSRLEGGEGPGPAGRAAGLSREGERARPEQALGELFPLAWNFIGNTCAGAAGHGRGRGGDFPLRLAGGSGPGPAGSGLSGEASAPPARSPWRTRPRNSAGSGRGPGRAGRAGEGWSRRDPGWSPGAAAGSALPWWFSSGMYILVFSLTIDQKLF